MKRHLLFLTFMSILSIGCSKKDPIGEYQALDIMYILQDGTPIITGDCIDPSANYAIQIRVSTEGNTNVKNTVIQYSVNGNLSSVTFTNSQTITINVPIVEGENVAQLVDSGFSNTIFVLAPSEFEIVP